MRPIRFFIILATLLSGFLTVAHAQTREDEAKAIASYDARYSDKEDDYKWSYDNDYSGQEEWGLINKAYAKCKIGTRQSPIVIAHTIRTTLPELQFNYKLAKAIVSNPGYAVMIEFNDPTLTLKEANKTYTLKNIEFHSPAEHEIHKEFYALEIQYLHESETGERVKVSVLAHMDKPLEGIASFIGAIPESGGAPQTIKINPAVFLPVYKGYYAYKGSLTIPPCTEDISWRILKTPIDVSKEQLIKISEHVGRNARLGQPIYTRTVFEHAEDWEFSK